MIAFSFKSVLLIGLTIGLGVVVLALVLDRRAARRYRLGLWPANEFQLAFDPAPLGVLVFDDPDGRLIYANPYARRSLALAGGAGPLPPVPWRAELLNDLALAHRSASLTSYRAFSPTDDRQVSWWVHYLASAQVSIVYLVDMSQQRKLESASRLFLNTLSHELRTPLTAILAHIEVLRRPNIASSVREVSLDLIHQETSRLARLVSDLLMLNRLELLPDLAERPVNLLLLIEEAIAEVFPLAETRQLSISLEADSPLRLVSGNEDYLRQALLNLLDNALKHCRPGDSIKVSVKNEADGVLCQLADSGPGIAPEHLPHLTQRFYRVNKSVEGSGLGLALVAEILQRHHSRLELDSQSEGESTGTTARFVLLSAPAEGHRLQP